MKSLLVFYVLLFVGIPLLSKNQDFSRIYLDYQWKTRNSEINGIEFPNVDIGRRLKGALCLEKFDNGEKLIFSNVQFSFGFCSETFVHLSCSGVTSNSFWCRYGDLEIKVRRPKELYLDRFYLLDSSSNVFRTWEVPFYGSSPISVSKNCDIVYFMESSNFLIGVSGEEIVRTESKNVPKWRLLKEAASPKGFKSAYGASIKFISDWAVYIIWFQYPCT